jgi:hypothetical protein
MKKLKLILLILFSVTTSKTFSQKDTIIKIPIDYARNIVKELLQFDTCKDQVKKQTDLIGLLEQKQSEQNNIIQNQRKLLIDKYKFSQNIGASTFISTPYLFTNLNFGTSKINFALQMNVTFTEKPHFTLLFSYQLWKTK